MGEHQLLLAPGSGCRSHISYLPASTLPRHLKPLSSLSFRSEEGIFCFKLPLVPAAAVRAKASCPQLILSCLARLHRVNLQVCCLLDPDWIWERSSPCRLGKKPLLEPSRGRNSCCCSGVWQGGGGCQHEPGYKGSVFLSL